MRKVLPPGSDPRAIQRLANTGWRHPEPIVARIFRDCSPPEIDHFLYHNTPPAAREIAREEAYPERRSLCSHNGGVPLLRTAGLMMSPTSVIARHGVPWQSPRRGLESTMRMDWNSGIASPLALLAMTK
jgi:hypothetical protein